MLGFDQNHAARTVPSWIWALGLLPALAGAIECPKEPEQTNKDWEVEVRAAVGKIGPFQGADLITKTHNVTQDLLGKLPQADRVYLEQMMYATYCSALRDDKALAESEKAVRIRAYNLEVHRTLSSPHARSESVAPASDPRGAARAELDRIPLPYVPEAFIESARSGNLRYVNLYLAAGMDPDAQDENGSTVLMYAAGNGDPRIVEVLLRAKADVNRQNAGGGSAISWAAARGHTDVVKLLRDHGASAAAIEHAIGAAAEIGAMDTLRLLFPKTGASDLATKALLAAAGAQFDDSVEAGVGEAVQFLLAKGGDVTARDSDGWTPLLLATLRNHAAIAKTLLDAGADKDAQCTGRSSSSYGGQSALMLSAHDGDVAILDLLLASGANPNLADVDGKTALMYMSDRRDPEGVRALLARGALVDARAQDGKTALTLASGNGDLATARILLEAGADVNARLPDGRTPLMMAVKVGSRELVLEMLRRGARIDARDENGLTAIDLAQEDTSADGTKMRKILMASGAH